MFQFSLRRLIKLGALSLALTASIGHSAVREGFNNSTAPNWTITGNSRLTAPNIDPEGQGWLRLNPLATSQTGRALLTGSSQALASNVPVYFEFEYVSWGGTGADGLVAFLYDADKDMAGARSGGSLGYCGGSGAYLAIGLDEYGNFSGPYDRDVKVCRFNDQANTRSQYVDSVVIRGPEGSNYPMVATKKYASGIDFPRATARPAATKVQVSLQPATVGYNITVTLIRNGVATKMFDNVSFPYAAPNNVRVGFGSATGLDTNVHEVRGQVLDVLTEVDVAKRLTSSDPAARGSTVSYSVSYANVSNFEITAGNIQYEDIVRSRTSVGRVAGTRALPPAETATSRESTRAPCRPVNLSASTLPGGCPGTWRMGKRSPIPRRSASYPIRPTPAPRRNPASASPRR